MPENEIGLRSVWDNKDFNRGQEEYSRGLNAATKETEEFNDALRSLIRGEQYVKTMDAANAAFDKMTDAEKEAFMATMELQDAERQLAAETEKLAKSQVNKESALKRVARAVDNVTRQYDGFKQILGDLGQAYDSTIGDYLRQAEAIRELSLVTGTAYEETSRLVQVFDDAGINTENLRASMIAMKNNGLTPSIEQIAKMADEYRAIQDPLKKVEYLTKNLGSRGTEVGKVFDMTGQQIRDAGAAVSESLIFDEQKIKAAEEMRMAEDNLKDALQGLKNEIVSGVVPGLAQLTGGFTQLIGSIKSAVTEHGVLERNLIFYKTLISAIKDELVGNTSATNENTSAIVEVDEATKAQVASSNLLNLALQNLKITQDGNTSSTRSASDAARGYVDAQEEAASAAEKARQETESNRVAFAVAAGLQNIYEDYIQTLSDLTDEHDDLIDKKEDLLKKGYSPEGNAVKEINDALAENTTKQDEAATAADKATKALIYQTAVAGLDGDAAAQLELARALGLVSEADYNLISATDEITARYKKTGDLEGYTKAMLALDQAAADGYVDASELKRILDELDGKTYSTQYNINTNYTTTGAGAGGAGASQNYDPAHPRFADGGDVAANVPIVVGEEGEELFVPQSAGKIISNKELKKMISGGGDFSGSVGKGKNPLSAFTELDFDVFDEMSSQIQDALSLAIDAGTIGEDEADLLYQSLSDQLIASLGSDTPLTDEFFASLTSGLGDLGDEVAEIARLEQIWAEQEEVVTKAEEALAAAEEKGEGVEEAKAALLAAEEAENITEEKLDSLKKQLEILKEQKDLQNEIKQAEEEAAEEARKAAEEAAKAAEEERQARIKAAEDALDAAKQAKDDAAEKVKDSEKRIANAQKELQRIADIEKEAARDAEIQKAKDAVDAAKSAIAEIEKAENAAQANKISATAEYNRLLRSGASKEELENAKAKIDAAQAQIEVEKQNKLIAEQKLATEEENLSATQERIDTIREEEDAAKFAEQKAAAQKELEDAQKEQETALAELQGATVNYNQAYNELRGLLNPDMQFIQSTGNQAREMRSMVESMAGLFGGFASERSITPITTNNTLNMPMTNQIAGNMDAAQIIGLIRQTVQQTFARR